MKATAPLATPLTAADLLHRGSYFLRQERLFEIVTWDAKAPLAVEARDVETGTTQHFSLTELFAPDPPTRFAASAAELLPPSPNGSLFQAAQVADAATLPGHLLQRADHLIQTVEAVQAQLQQIQRRAARAGETLSVTQATLQACQSLPTPLSLSGYYKYRHLYRFHRGDRALIAAALHRSTYGKTPTDPNTQHFIDTIIRRFYRSNPPLRAQTVYDLAHALWRHNRHWWLNFVQTGQPPDDDELFAGLLNGKQALDPWLADPAQAARLVQIQFPSRTWFYSYINWFTTQPEEDSEGAQVYIARYGKADWEANFLLFDQFVRTATLPLQFVFADHYRLDILHVDDEFRETLPRLWLTVLIDAFSRAVLGLSLAYEDPCIESIQGALRHAIWPKTHLGQFGIDLPWACYGIPQHLSLDNAWAHHSYSLEDLTRALSGAGRYTQMDLVFRPPYQARYGALVERLFGNLSGQLRERLPGAILQPDQRHWHNPNQGACLLFRDVERFIHQIVVDYLHTPHRELDGLTPHEKWLAGLQLMTPVPPPLTPQLERCFWRLHPETRLAARGGLMLFGLHYWDLGLAGLRGRDRQGGRRHFHLRYAPADVSRVAVFEQGLWLGDAYARELRLPDGTYEPASVWELTLAKALAPQRHPERPARPHSWLIHLLEARELVAQRQTEQKAIRCKVQQLREHRKKGRPPSTTAAKREALEAAQVQEAHQALTTLEADAQDPRTRLLKNLHEVL